MCWVSFEPNNLVLTGASYGADKYGNPYDYFQSAFLTEINSDYTVILDLYVDA